MGLLKAETAWFHEEANRMFELVSLPDRPPGAKRPASTVQ
jgi:hypothetical protein